MTQLSAMIRLTSASAMAKQMILTLASSSYTSRTTASSSGSPHARASSRTDLPRYARLRSVLREAIRIPSHEASSAGPRQARRAAPISVTTFRRTPASPSAGRKRSAPRATSQGGRQSIRLLP